MSCKLLEVTKLSFVYYFRIGLSSKMFTEVIMDRMLMATLGDCSMAFPLKKLPKKYRDIRKGKLLNFRRQENHHGRRGRRNHCSCCLPSDLNDLRGKQWISAKKTRIENELTLEEEKLPTEILLDIFRFYAEDISAKAVSDLEIIIARE